VLSRSSVERVLDQSVRVRRGEVRELFGLFNINQDLGVLHGWSPFGVGERCRAATSTGYL
jgi:hypothetical protein